MTKGLTLLVLLTIGGTAAAHPGVGIVQDRRGNVFFTDLKQVWKVAPDGSRSIAVLDVHTHELDLDGDDNLFGEHLRYDGAAGTWWHRIWRRTPEGVVSDVVPERQGFLNDDGFVRDRDGARYWADRGERTAIKKRSGDGRVTTITEDGFRDVGWMTAAADGTLYLMDAGDLKRVSPGGAVTTVVAKLSGRERPPAEVPERHYHMGLWTDEAGSVYVAVARERLVVRVSPEGKRDVVVRSAGSWSPSGGLIDCEGRLWLLEYDETNAVRARRIGRDGKETTFPGDSHGR